ERLVRRTEAPNRRKFHDGFYLTFEQNRQDYDVRWMEFAQTGTHFGIIVRHIAQKNAPFFQRRLSDETLAQFEAALCAVAFMRSVARQQLKLRFSVKIIDHVESALLR